MHINQAAEKEVVGIGSMVKLDVLEILSFFRMLKYNVMIRNGELHQQFVNASFLLDKDIFPYFPTYFRESKSE